MRETRNPPRHECRAALSGASVVGHQPATGASGMRATVPRHEPLLLVQDLQSFARAPDPEGFAREHSVKQRRSRRAFLTGVAATAAAAAMPRPPETNVAQAPPIPIIDTHIHLFDPTRPQGAPYSGPRPAPGATPIAAYPERYRRLAVPLGVVGAIKVEASPWIEDSLWVLEAVQRDPIMVGVIGNLEPDKPEFPQCAMEAMTSSRARRVDSVQIPWRVRAATSGATLRRPARGAYLANGFGRSWKC